MYDGRLVRLRAVEPELDFPAYHRWWNDPVVTRFLPTRYPVSTATVRARLDGRAEPRLEAAWFSVELRETGALVGSAGLRDTGPESRHAELDVVVGEPALWGRGIGTDAIRTVCRFGFDELALHRVRAYVHLGHEAALTACRHVGFVTEGTVRDAWYRGGSRHSLAYLGLLAPELLRD